MSFKIRQATVLAFEFDFETLAPLCDGYRQFYGQPEDLTRAHDFLAERPRQHEPRTLLARDDCIEELGFTQRYSLFSLV